MKIADIKNYFSLISFGDNSNLIKTIEILRKRIEELERESIEKDKKIFEDKLKIKYLKLKVKDLENNKRNKKRKLKKNTIQP